MVQSYFFEMGISLPYDISLVKKKRKHLKQNNEAETDGIAKIEYRLVPCTVSTLGIPYRTVPYRIVKFIYRTVTAQGSRYTVSQNTVPLDRFFYFLETTINLFCFGYRLLLRRMLTKH